MQYVPVRGWRIGTPPKPPKAAVPAGVLFWEVSVGRSVVEKSIGEGREAARQEFRWIWGGENASATESVQREAFGWVLGRGNKGSHVVIKRAVRTDAPGL